MWYWLGYMPGFIQLLAGLLWKLPEGFVHMLGALCFSLWSLSLSLSLHIVT